MHCANKVVLRAMEPSDVNLIYDWENDSSEWASSSNYCPISYADIKRFVETSSADIYETRQMRQMVVDAVTGRRVGYVDMFDFDPFNMHGGVGVYIEKCSRNKGYASSAIDIFTNYLFDVLSLVTVIATIREDNKYSEKLFLSNGYQLVGSRKVWIRVGNKWFDEMIYQRVR